MTLCALCAQPTMSGTNLCVYHPSFHDDDWAAGNRIMCDFVHRGIAPAAPPDWVHDLEPLVEALDEAVAA